MSPRLCSELNDICIEIGFTLRSIMQIKGRYISNRIQLINTKCTEVPTISLK